MIHKFTIHKSKHGDFVTREFIYTSPRHAEELYIELIQEGFYSSAAQYVNRPKPFWDLVSSSLQACPDLPRKARGKLTVKDYVRIDKGKEASILVCLY